MTHPKVSIIVPTRNSSRTLSACLDSISGQTYKNIELIVVDRSSSDETKKIAKKYTNSVYDKGPERCAQRNYGVAKSMGDFVAIIDSDMNLSPTVIEECIAAISLPDSVGVIIPEESFGEGFWAQCKKLERSFYVGVDYMEAARFFRKKDFNAVGGYDESMVSGEDWDLSQRIESHTHRVLRRTRAFIFHDEGHISLIKTIRKKFYYAQKFAAYTRKNTTHSNTDKQTGIAGRYWLFLSHPRKLFRNPIIGIGMLFMKTCEFGFGGVGYMIASLRS